MNNPVLPYSRKNRGANGTKAVVDLEKWILNSPNDKFCDPANILIATDLIIEQRELELSVEGNVYYCFTKDGITIAILNIAELFKDSYHIQLIQ